MKETDYEKRIEVVRLWLQTAGKLIKERDMEFGYDKLVHSLNELQSIIDRINKK